MSAVRADIFFTQEQLSKNTNVIPKTMHALGLLMLNILYIDATKTNKII